MFVTPAGVSAQTRVTPEVRGWLSALVAKVATAVEVTCLDPGRHRLVVVEVRVVVAPDGMLRGVSVERGSGSRRTDDSALTAVMATTPFGPPPKDFVARDGTADLRFRMEMAHRR